MKLKFKYIAALVSLAFFASSLNAQAPEGYTWQDTSSVDFGAGANHFSIEAASAGSGGEVQLHLDSADGPVIGRVFFHHTGNNAFFMDYECDLKQIVSGVHDVYMNFQDYTSPDEGGNLVVGNFTFSLFEDPLVPSEGNLHVYAPVPGLDPSPYYTYEVQKVSALNSSNLADVSNWEKPFAWFTKCYAKDDPDRPSAYYSNFIGSWSHTYCNFELDSNTTIVVKITRLDKEGAPSGPITMAVPHPARKVESCEIIDGDVYVTMRNPAQVAIDIDGQLDSRNAPRAIANSWNDSEAFPYANEMDGAHGVTIFANPFITDKPDPDGAGVKKVNPGDPMPEDDGTWSTLYFMPGIHNMSVDENGNEREWRPEDVYKINSNCQYYIPGDAIVYGNFNDKDSTGWFGQAFENIRLYGHGTISGAKRPHWKDWPEEYNDVSHSLLRVFEVSDPRNVIVEGITSADQAEHGIYLIAQNRNDYSPNYIKWVKMIGWRVNTDGMVGYGNSYIEDCFLRLQDDAFYVTGMAIRRCVIWADVNGAPFRGDRFLNERGGDYMESGLPKDLLVEDIDVIYTRGVFSSTGTVIGGGGNIGEKTYSDGTDNTGQHLVFRNMNIEDPRPQRLLMGTSERNLMGVRFENINFQHPHVWDSIPSISGAEDAPLKYWVFDNVRIAGENVDAEYLNNPQKFETNFVQDFTYRLSDTIHSTGYTLIRTAINGTIALDTIARASDEVSVIATPLSGYKFDGWSGDLNGSDNPATITMDADKGITANFSLITYIIDTTAANGTFIFDPAQEVYLPGTEVTVTAVGDLGYGFDTWGGDLSGAENPATITMDSDKSISATFITGPTYVLTLDATYGTVVLDPPGGEYNPETVVTLNPDPDPGYVFGEWVGDLSGSEFPETISMDTDKTVSARFFYVGGGSTSYAVNCGGGAYSAADGVNYQEDTSGGSSYSTSSSIAGTNDDVIYQSERYGNSFSYNIPVENGSYQVVLMFAEIFHSSAGQRVFNVSIEGEEVISNLDIFSKVGKNAAYNETYDVTISDGVINISFTTIADNAKISAIRVVDLAFQGETFTLTTNAVNNGTLSTDPEEIIYPAGSNVQITAVPDMGYMFEAWNGDLAGSENPSYLYMDGDKSIGATFIEVNYYTLSTSATNGSIQADPGPESQGYVEGTVVSLSPSADAGYFFSGWGGDLDGTETPATILMNADKNVRANFELIPVYTLTTSVSNGTIQLTPDGGSYEEGTVVTVKAVPNAGFAFNGWGGDLSGTENPTTIVMDSDKEISAEILDVIVYTLTTNAENGTIEIYPRYETYTPGAAVVLQATPDEGYLFEEWTGDLSGTENPTSLILDEDKTITALFTPVTSVIDVYGEIPAKNILGQNYPNPFTSETHISYQLEEASYVKLSVYTVLGQEVLSLVHQYQDAGSYEVVWHSRDLSGNLLPEGMYFYKLENGNNSVLIKKAILQ